MMVHQGRIGNILAAGTCWTKECPVIHITGVFKHVITQSTYLKCENLSLCCLVWWCVPNCTLRSIERKWWTIECMLKYVKGKGYKTIYKQLDVPVATDYSELKVHRTVANLPGRGCKRKINDKLKRWIKMNSNHRAPNNSQTDEKWIPGYVSIRSHYPSLFELKWTDVGDDRGTTVERKS